MVPRVFFSSEESEDECQGTNAFSASMAKFVHTKSFSTSSKLVIAAEVVGLEGRTHTDANNAHVFQRLSASDEEGSLPVVHGEQLKAQMAVLQRTVQRLDASLSEHKRIHASVNAQILSKLDLLIGQPHMAPQASSEGRDPLPAVCPRQPPLPHALSSFAALEPKKQRLADMKARLEASKALAASLSQ